MPFQHIHDQAGPGEIFGATAFTRMWIMVFIESAFLNQTG